jgi:hypothetical protein
VNDQQPKHPVGTLAIVGIYGLLCAVGWLATSADAALRLAGFPP